MSNLTPDSVTRQPHLLAFELLMQQRFRRIPVDAILYHFLDTVRVELLPVLAEEFDVLGVKGWDFATTEQEQRDLLKNSISLKRSRGTVWAIKEALKLTQYQVYTFTEGSGGHWAKFRISVSQNDYAIDVQKLDQAAALVNEYKRAAAWFEGIYVTDVDYSDAITVTESAVINAAVPAFTGEEVNVTGPFTLNGTVTLSGIRNFANETDCIVINQV